MTDKTKTYTCTAGINHSRGRNERGEGYSGREKSLPWLLEQGHVVEDGTATHERLLVELAAETTSEEA